MAMIRKIMIGALGALLLFSGALCLFSYHLYLKEGPLLKTENIVIPHGTTKELTRLLQNNNILDQDRFTALLFRIIVYATKSQGELHSAELLFPEHVSMKQAINILRHNRPVIHSFTIAEGVTAQEIKENLEKAPALKGNIEDFQEGTLFPQTYFYQWGEERKDLILHAQKLMNSKLKIIWENRDRDALNNIITTPQELLILASLIEKETSVSSERPLISRVFLNRLEKHMKLQTDPTVIYALTQGRGHLMRSLSHEDLKIMSPYNTYIVNNLPPSPICSPSEDALYAAAHPKDGDIFYFVASGKGGHQFARTLSEQNNHIRSYHYLKKMNGK